MIEREMIEVTFQRQTVYHDGTSMVVAKAKEKREVSLALAEKFAIEGAIAEVAPKVKAPKAKEELPTADLTADTATGAAP